MSTESVQNNKLSKQVSYMLRHAPEEYLLSLDEEGWVDLEIFLRAIKKLPEWVGLSKNGLLIMIKSSEKKRHEVENGKIRALYGHSIPKKIIKSGVIPPNFLFHGTSSEALASILQQGILPMSRQYVHLSEDIDTAILVAKRKSKDIAILTIDTQQALQKGIKFYHGSDGTWLTDAIFNECIKLV